MERSIRKRRSFFNGQLIPPQSGPGHEHDPEPAAPEHEHEHDPEPAAPPLYVPESSESGLRPPKPHLDD